MRYKLPEALGGGELDEYRHVDGGTEAPVGTVAFLVEGCIVAVARGLLTEVKPPLPEEPPFGAVVLDSDEQAWQRFMPTPPGDRSGVGRCHRRHGDQHRRNPARHVGGNHRRRSPERKQLT